VLPTQVQIAMPPKTESPRRTPARTKPAQPGAKPAAKFRLRVMAGGVIAIGPGKIDLLEAIDQTGSITAAAKSLDMSYRRAWLLLDELNSSLRLPAVDSAKGGQHGGGSELTEVGRQVIDLYRRVEVTAARASRTDMSRLLGLLAG
jgi:molybdate transport system regulatory protein